MWKVTNYPGHPGHPCIYAGREETPSHEETPREGSAVALSTVSVRLRSHAGQLATLSPYPFESARRESH